MRFLDTNIFIRGLTNDHAVWSDRSRRLLTAIDDGLEDATTSESVLAEIVFVLSSPATYRLSRRAIHELLEPILSMTHLRLNGRGLYLRALDIYAEHNVDFEDALSVAHVEARGYEAIVSFDRDFDRIEGVRRDEP
jgi:predicted nucleic acid-binding protein